MLFLQEAGNLLYSLIQMGLLEHALQSKLVDTSNGKVISLTFQKKNSNEILF